MNKLTIKKIQDLGSRLYFTFKEKEYQVRYDKSLDKYVCTCENGSFVGSKGKQTCTHIILCKLNQKSGVTSIDRDNLEFKKYQRSINKKLKNKKK